MSANFAQLSNQICSADTLDVKKHSIGSMRSLKEA